LSKTYSAANTYSCGLTLASYAKTNFWFQLFMFMKKHTHSRWRDNALCSVETGRAVICSLFILFKQNIYCT